MTTGYSYLKSFRFFLLPFSWIWAAVLVIRNFLYDKQIFKSSEYGLPLIVVGNLSIGGTGKSPMVEYLTELLKNSFRVAIISRGYKRKTRGYVLAGKDTSSLDIGDEPMQFYKKFPDVPVAVGEDRNIAIAQLMYDRPETQVILLDDAFQHRAVKAGMNILLTDYDNLFTKDFYLPAGDLRDLKSSYKRAHLIVITKCPSHINEDEKRKIIREIRPQPHQQLFFTALEYGNPYLLFGKTSGYPSPDGEVLLITGIANPQPLKKYLEQHFSAYQLMEFPDHHIFSIDDWLAIKKKFDSISNPEKYILTTEKDAVRLEKFSKDEAAPPVFVLPVKHRFLFNEDKLFEDKIRYYILQNISENGQKTFSKT
ncbi:MAG: tetraacyldisaccharide 4'-kinase [Chitinophagaceae bacterium]|nr:tetraacyldisaccharide 4'-kinase [Chitinophagaceae bacterium]